MVVVSIVSKLNVAIKCNLKRGKKMSTMLTVAESAERMKVTKVTIYQWIKRGLPTDKQFEGTKPTQYIDTDDLDKFVSEAQNGQ